MAPKKDVDLVKKISKKQNFHDTLRESLILAIEDLSPKSTAKEIRRGKRSKVVGTGDNRKETRVEPKENEGKVGSEPAMGQASTVSLPLNLIPRHILENPGMFTDIISLGLQAAYRDGQEERNKFVGLETAKMVTDLNILQRQEMKWSKYYHDSRGPSPAQAATNRMDVKKKITYCFYYIYNDLCKSRAMYNGKWVSNRIEQFDIRLLSTAEFRQKSATEAESMMRRHAVCAKCAVNIPAQCKAPLTRGMCICCLIGMRAENGTREVGWCAQCRESFMDSTNKKANVYLENCLECLEYVIPGLTQYGMQNRARMDTRYPDLLLSGMIENINFMIIIEKDEDMHGRNNRMDEMTKDKIQVSAGIEQMRMKANGDNRAWRLLYIRFNSNGDYRLGEGVRTRRYTELERYIIVRRWIIWYMRELVHKRHFIMMYMFYNEERAMSYRGYNGRMMLYNAPQPRPHEKDWTFCATPQELLKIPIGQYYDDINPAQFVYSPEVILPDQSFIVA